jgi:8-oxo-dGTP pyrophosphatase MutT (NUDIX family)
MPQDKVFAIAGIDLGVEAEPHPYEAAHAASIEANWTLERGRNPALFDGRMILFSALALRGGRLEGRGHAVRFASFLHWRARPHADQAAHCFAHAVLVAGDGALLAVRMAASTANAGKVYFAAGSFEHADVHEGRVDVEANMRREVAEETGLDLRTAKAESGWHGWSREGRTVVFRRYRFAEPANVLARRVEAHVAAESDPEISGPVVLRRPSDLPPETVAHMPALVGWHFSAAR